MNPAPLQSRYADILGRIRQPARLIGSEWGAGPGFSGIEDELRVVLSFPDAYEIGISNEAIQILYHLALGREDVGVERTYLPWIDAAAEMREAGIPLLTMETWAPVGSADLLGVTLQHEFNYTNVLEMLDLARIPLLAEERGEEDPLVIGGGPAVADFLPMAPFLDAVAVGDGEELFLEVLDLLSVAKRAGASREDRKRRLAEIEGIYVPGVSSGVQRRVLARLEDAPYPASCLVSLTAGVHDRAWVEVMRGCTRGCRFCQAGMWYRPVRERSAEQVLRMVGEQLEATGHDELALASLSTTDYSALGPVLEGVGRLHPETRVSLPSLRVDSAAVRLAHLASPTGAALTLAPEAGSQRMRDIINKNVSEQDILSAVEEAFGCGYTSLKLYFIIGLPLEEDDDVQAIADLCLRMRDVGRRALGARANRLQLSVSVNNFVPKPFTPFQRAGMADRETLLRRQELLRSRLRRRGVRLSLHDVDTSYLEAALARGGEEMAEVILGAWRRGARFDSWTEQFCAGAWEEAFAASGTTAEQLATAEIPAEAALPWQVVGVVVDDDFLQEEWQRAARGEPTPDCRDGECSDCGACIGETAIDLAVPGATLSDPRVQTPQAREGAPAAQGPQASRHTRSATGRGGAELSDAAETSGAAGDLERTYLLTFAVSGRARFIGHLDKSQIFRRAIRRAGGRLALSAGLRPKPRLGLVLPLGVGMESAAELCEFTLSERPPRDFFQRLEEALPTGLTAVALEPYWARKSAAARVIGAEYEVEVQVEVQVDVPVDPDGSDPTSGEAWGGTSPEAVSEALSMAAGRFIDADSLPVTEPHKGGTRVVDVRAYVDKVEVVGSGADHAADHGVGVADSHVANRAHRPGAGSAVLRFTITMTPTGSVRPERVVEAFAGLAGVRMSVLRGVRTRILLS